MKKKIAGKVGALLTAATMAFTGKRQADRGGNGLFSL